MSNPTACLYYRDCWSLSLRFSSFDMLVAFLDERLGKKGYLIESGPKGHTIYRNLEHALQVQEARKIGRNEYGNDTPTATVEVMDEARDAEVASWGVEFAA